MHFNTSYYFSIYAAKQFIQECVHLVICVKETYLRVLFIPLLFAPLLHAQFDNYKCDVRTWKSL